MVEPLTDCDLLTLWEQGAQRHPIDRTLLLCSCAYPHLPGNGLADLPLGAVQRILLQLQASWYGSPFEAWAPCGDCGSLQEVQLDALELLDSLPSPDSAVAVQVEGKRYRLPTSRDLAAVIALKDATSAARQLLERCLLHSDPAGDSSPLGPVADSDGLTEGWELRAAETALEDADPAADISLSLTCSDCGHGWCTSLDMGALLWDRISERARALLLDVHDLAWAYGWSEPQILALSPWRRAAYRNLLSP